MNIDDIIENAQLKGRIIALDAQVETLTAEVRCLEAVIRSHERVDCLTVANLKAEVERLESDLKLEKENEDRLVRLWQTANNEVHGQRSQIAALIDNQTSLKAELDRVTSQNGYAYTGLAVGMLRDELAHKCHDNLEIRKAHQATVQMVRDLQAEVERLRKAGDEVIQNLHPEEGDWCFEDAEATWNAAKEGKQS